MPCRPPQLGPGLLRSGTSRSRSYTGFAVATAPLAAASALPMPNLSSLLAPLSGSQSSTSQGSIKANGKHPEPTGLPLGLKGSIARGQPTPTPAPASPPAKKGRKSAKKEKQSSERLSLAAASKEAGPSNLNMQPVASTSTLPPAPSSASGQPSKQPDKSKGKKLPKRRISSSNPPALPLPAAAVHEEPPHLSRTTRSKLGLVVTGSTSLKAPQGTPVADLKRPAPTVSPPPVSIGSSAKRTPPPFLAVADRFGAAAASTPPVRKQAGLTRSSQILPLIAAPGMRTRDKLSSKRRQKQVEKQERLKKRAKILAKKKERTPAAPLQLQRARELEESFADEVEIHRPPQPTYFSTPGAIPSKGGVVGEDNYRLLLMGLPFDTTASSLHQRLLAHIDERDVPPLEFRRIADGQSLIAVASNLSLRVYEQIQRAFPPLGHQQPEALTCSSSILARSSSPTAACSSVWAEDGNPVYYRWMPIWSALGKGKGRAGESLPIDRLSVESEAVCDEFGWHFFARFPRKSNRGLERDLLGLVRFPSAEQGRTPHLREMIHPLKASSKVGAEPTSAYLIFPHGTQVLQPAFDRLLAADSIQSDTGPRRLSLRHATAKDLHRLLASYSWRAAKPVPPVDHVPRVMPAADPHAYLWHDETFSSPAFFTSQEAKAAEARTKAESTSVETEWWKPAFQFARALAWTRFLSLLPAWPTAPGRQKATSWRSVLGSLPDTLAFVDRPSAPRPTRVHISGLPARYKTSFLTNHLRTRPDYGSWVNFLRRAPTVHRMALLQDAKDASGMASVRLQSLFGQRDGFHGRERVEDWLGKSLVGASIEKLPSRSQDSTEFLLVLPSVSDAQRLVRMMDGTVLSSEDEPSSRRRMTVRMAP